MKKANCSCIAFEVEDYFRKKMDIRPEDTLNMTIYVKNKAQVFVDGIPKYKKVFLDSNFCPQCGKEYKEEN